MRRVSEHVGVEENIGDIAADIDANTGAIEQSARKVAEVVGAKARRVLCGRVHAGAGLTAS